jgi:hypothetical protein
MDAYINGSFPNYQARAHQTKSDVYRLLLPKIQKIIDRGYVQFGRTQNFVKSYIDYFIVPKADDVRPVYNGTSSGFNAAVWAPNFLAPHSQIRNMGFGLQLLWGGHRLGRDVPQLPSPEGILTIFWDRP